MADTRQTTSEDRTFDVAGEIIGSPPRPGSSVAQAAGTGRGIGALRRARDLFQHRPPVVDAEVSYLPSEQPQTRSVPIGRITFAVCVAFPALLALIYFAFLASDQYVAEMRFVIRQGGQDGFRSMLSGIGGGGAGNAGNMVAAAMGGSSSSTASEDGHIVTSYIHSRAMVDDIGKTVNLRDIFTRQGADFYARLSRDVSVDDLVLYWNRMVSTAIDGTSGIITVSVRAFRPADAVLVAQAIQDLSEKLVNEMSIRARRDALRRATEEVARAQGLMTEALLEMERYRNQEGLIDPLQTATETGKLLTRVLTDQLTVEAQLFVSSRSLGPDSPTIRNIQSRVDSLKAQAATLRQQLAGNKGDTRNVAAALVKFEEIAVKQKVAESLYVLAEGGLDRARRTAEARSIYLTPFVPPSLPEDSTYPKRFLFPLGIAIVCLALWSIVALIWASVQDHRLR